jgi:hypothetical protein
MFEEFSLYPVSLENGNRAFFMSLEIWPPALTTTAPQAPSREAPAFRLETVPEVGRFSLELEGSLFDHRRK